MINITLDQFITFFEQHGFFWVFTVIVLWFMFRYFNRKLEGLQHRPDEPFNRAIQTHSIQATLDNILQIGIHRLHYPNAFQQRLFPDLLLSLFQMFQTHLDDLLTSTLIDHPRMQFKLKLLQALTTMFSDAEQQTIQLLNQHFTNVPAGVNPGQVILRKYNQFFDCYQRALFQSIEDVCDSDILSTNPERFAAILYILKEKFLLVMFNAERVLATMNGELIGWTYKGITNTSEENPV